MSSDRYFLLFKAALCFLVSVDVWLLFFLIYLVKQYLKPMAFRPGKNQQFYLSAKQLGKVIGVKETRNGAPLQLLDYTANDVKQVFRFDFGDGFYWFKFPTLDRYVTVNAASGDNNVPLIFWEWESGRHHQMFEFIPAENGYYRIRARHSGKYLEVVENKQDRTHILMQNQLNANDNQLFYPVLLPEKETGLPPSFYSTKTDLKRTVYLGLIGLIPDVGKGLGFVVGYFWKERDQLSDFWDTMKNYVDVRIRTLIKESEIRFLEEEFKGYMNVLAEICFSPQPKKGNRIQAVMDNMIHSTPHFTDKHDEILPLLIAYGTVLIILRKMMCDNYEELFGEPPSEQLKLANYLSLVSTIKIFSDAVERSKVNYRKWRMAQFPDSKVISPGGTTQAVMTDNYEDITLSWLDPHYRDGSPDFEFRAKAITELRRGAVKPQFELQLEELTMAARFWKYFNPVVPFIGTFNYAVVGSYGGIVYTAKTFHMEDKYTFDRVDFFSRNGNLSGMELFYKGTSYGAIGTATQERVTLQLQEGEYINSVYGYAKNWVRSLWMTTNKGRKAGVGGYGDRNEFFCADLPDSYGARLHGIDARYDESIIKENQIMLLTFRWKYDSYV